MTDQLGQSQVLPYLCELQKAGYTYHLISCEKPERYEKYKGIIEEICSRNNIHWHPIPYTKKPPVLSTVKDVRAIRKKAVSLHETLSFSLVHCRGYISSIIGLEMKRKKNVPFLFDMRGLWADEKVDAGSWNLKNPLYKMVYRFFKKKETQFLQEADYTISLTEAARNEISSWKHVPQLAPIEVIPCCADLKHFDPSAVTDAAKDQMRTELGIRKDSTVLTYLGSIGSWYMLDEMLDFFLVYRQAYPEASFLFITGDQHDLIRRKAAERNIPSDRLVIRPAQRKEVPVLVSLGMHSVFFIRPTYSKISSSPTKQAELMGMGVPVICNARVGDTGPVVKKYGAGIVIDDFNTQAYQTAISELKQAHFEGSSIRNGAFDYFSLDQGVKRYLQIYQQVCR